MANGEQGFPIKRPWTVHHSQRRGGNPGKKLKSKMEKKEGRCEKPVGANEVDPGGEKGQSEREFQGSNAKGGRGEDRSF